MAEKLSLLDRAPVAILGSGPDAMWPEARRRTQVIPAALPGKSADDSLLDRFLDRDGHPRLALDSGEKITLPALGIHQLENAQIALAVAQRAGVDHDAAVRALAGLQLPEGRGEIREIGNLMVIDDSYNANPSSMRRAVQTAAWLATRHRRPLVVVVGTMLELGAESARLHADVAREIAARLISGATGCSVAVCNTCSPRLIVMRLLGSVRCCEIGKKNERRPSPNPTFARSSRYSFAPSLAMWRPFTEISISTGPSSSTQPAIQYGLHSSICQRQTINMAPKA